MAGTIPIGGPIPRVLNVGGGSKAIDLPEFYTGWEQVFLDIDPSVSPDVCCDARELTTLDKGLYDAVYCSHNLEHYYRHDAVKVLAGFRHVLKSDGVAHIRVPDVMKAVQHVVVNEGDLDTVLYESPIGPISFRDLLYGHAGLVEKAGRDFMAHKNGFSKISLKKFMNDNGFPYVAILSHGFEVTAMAFTESPSERIRALIGM